MTDTNYIPHPLNQRHYVVVVHGIGNQKLNATVPPVVHRFAEVRQKKKAKFYQVLLPATLSSQSVRSKSEFHGWAEFRGIPIEDNQNIEDFDGTPATETAGDNFRFVELYWQDILQSHQEKFASKTEDWAKALLERLQDPAITPDDWLPSWAVQMLRSIINVAIPVKNMMALKYTQAAKLIFDDFLGDVHLYGDYGRTRGEAVRLFHASLDKIIFFDFLDWRKREISISRLTGEQLMPLPYQPPKITIIAHSLGSIMSFDALVYAFTKKNIRNATAESVEYSSSFPFSGYTMPSIEEEAMFEKNKKRLDDFIGIIERTLDDTGQKKYWENFLDGFSGLGDTEVQLLNQSTKQSPPELNGAAQYCIPHLLWKKSVRNFITIGSPIDKYLALWHQNYLHMGLKIKDYTTPARWVFNLDKEYDITEEIDAASDRDQRINHYNFCDEQDPVGHHLDLTRQTEVYQKLFDTKDTLKRDIVFRRYGVPGLAHNKYWEDGDLFKGILREILDRREPGTSSYFMKEDFREKKNAYIQGFSWAYLRPALLFSLITGMIFSYGWYNINQGNPEKINWLSSSIAILLSVWLWITPSFSAFYKKRSAIENADEPTYKLIFRTIISPGIFSQLIMTSVEWRRILLSQSEGGNIKGENNDERFAFQQKEQNFIWWPFIWRWSIRFFGTTALSIFILYFLPDIILNGNVYGLTIPFLGTYLITVTTLLFQNFLNILMPVLLVYLISLLYVFYLFFKSKSRLNRNRNLG